MTREQKIAEARKLHAKGWAVVRIGRQLGVAHSTVWRWLNPERAREHAARDNARRNKAKQEWARSKADPCVDCGGTVSKAKRTRCGRCAREHEQAEAKMRVGQWIALRREGLSNRHIAEQEDIPVYVVANTLSRARHRWGLDVPDVKLGRPPKRVAA